MRYAIADLGTNTFHLLVAEKGNPFHILYDEKVAVGLGRGGINKGHITDEAKERALVCMRYFSEILSSFGIEKGIAIGTSAMRSAINGKVLAEKIESETSFKVEIIDGLEEAALIYDGVKASGVLDETPGVIVDIGGGSVEFIICNQQKIFWKKSFEIGGVRLLEKFQKHDPILKEEIMQLREYFDSQLGLLSEAILEYKPAYMVGSSGAFDTLTEMQLEFLHSPLKLKELSRYNIEQNSFIRMYEEIISKNRAERLLIPGMRELRVEMMVVAMVLIKYLADKYSLMEIRACMYALKEGAMVRKMLTPQS